MAGKVVINRRGLSETSPKCNNLELVFLKVGRFLGAEHLTKEVGRFNDTFGLPKVLPHATRIADRVLRVGLLGVAQGEILQDIDDFVEADFLATLSVRHSPICPSEFVRSIERPGHRSRFVP